MKLGWSKTAMIIVGGLLSLLGYYFLLAPMLEKLELNTLTQRQLSFQKQPYTKQNTPLVLIGIDRYSDTKMTDLLGVKWRREALTIVVPYLKQLNPKVVLIDIAFNGGSFIDKKNLDATFSGLFKGTETFASDLMFENFVDPKLSFQNQSLAVQQKIKDLSVEIQGIQYLDYDLKRLIFYSLNPPYDGLFLHSDMKFFPPNALVNDALGISRYVAPVVFFGGATLPNTPLGLLLNNRKQLTLNREGELTWEGGSVRLGNRGLPLVKWYGNQTTSQRPYPEIAFIDLFYRALHQQCTQAGFIRRDLCTQLPADYRPAYQLTWIKDKYVFIGMTSENDGDVHSSIYPRFGGTSNKYPGVYIMANQFDNALNNDFVIRVPVWVDMTAVVLMLAVGVYLVRRYSVLLGLLALVSLSACYYFLALKAYTDWNYWLNVTNPIAMLWVTYAATYIWQYQRSEKQRQQLRFAFGKYVSPGVMASIEKNPEQLKLGGQRQELTILFCDIRGFTQYSETHEPEEVQQFLTEYFGMMNHIILNEYRGSINKLMGDAVMAYWGWPLTSDDHAVLAVQAALKMREAVAVLRQKINWPEFQIGVGINTGDVLIGNVGSGDFMDFTVIGDAVNIASRIESLNKEHGTTIIMTEETARRVEARPDIQVKACFLGETPIRGKSQNIKIYEPVVF